MNLLLYIPSETVGFLPVPYRYVRDGRCHGQGQRHAPAANSPQGWAGHPAHSGPAGGGYSYCTEGRKVVFFQV